MLTEPLARLVAETDAAAFTDAMIENATAALVDTVGCAIAGGDSQVSRKIQRYVLAEGGSQQARLWGTPYSASPAEAAFCNAVAGHALDFDDSLPVLRGHPSVPILSAGMATTSYTKVSGRGLLQAYVLALEVAGRIGIALGHGHYTSGWHVTATAGTFSATAVSARLLGLDVEQVRNAFGLAAADSAGLIRNFGTMAKAVQVGRSARAGLVAARLAAEGVTADCDILDGSGGFIAAYGQPAAADDRAGWLILDPGIYVKRWPCCYANHRALAGIFELIEGHRIGVADITEIAVGFLPDADKALVHTVPTNGLEAKFSIEYCAAAAVLDGAVTLGSFSEEAVWRENVRALMSKVRRFAMPGQGSFSGVHGYTDVAISTRQGRFETRVEHTPGSPEAPMTRKDRRDKFLGCVVPVLGAESAERLLDRLERMVDEPDAAGMMDLAVPDLARARVA